jgi:hypothetical protein
LDPDSRAKTPDMLVYSSSNDPLNKIAPTPPPAPPAPPAPPIPSTSQGAPSGLLAEIEQGRKLRKTTTVIKDATKIGNVVTQSNEDGMLGQLKNRFNKLRPMITGDESELDDSKSGDL